MVFSEQNGAHVVGEVWLSNRSVTAESLVC